MPGEADRRGGDPILSCSQPTASVDQQSTFIRFINSVGCAWLRGNSREETGISAEYPEILDSR